MTLYAWLMKQYITRKDGSRCGRAVNMDTGDIIFVNWTKDIKDSVLQSELQIPTKDCDNIYTSMAILEQWKISWPEELE